MPDTKNENEEFWLINEITWALFWTEQSYYGPISKIAKIAEAEVWEGPERTNRRLAYMREDEQISNTYTRLQRLDPRFAVWLRRWADLCDAAEFARVAGMTEQEAA